jgi:RND family efflux transporter MFP subunit
MPAAARETGSHAHRDGRRRAASWGAAGLLVAAGALGAYLLALQPESGGGAARAATPVPVDAGQGGRFEAAGFVVARRQATVAAEVTGRVIALPFEEGQAVERGMVLARLDSRSAETEVATSQAEEGTARARVAASEAQLANARQAHERSRSLLASGFVTAARASADEAAMRTLEAEVARGRAELEAQQLRIRRSRQELSKFTIRAPFAGVVIGRNAQVGEMISPISAGGGFTRTGICTIVDMNSLELSVDVSEQNIGRVAVGDMAVATLDAYREIRMPARVTAIIPAANREKGTVTVRLALTRPDQRVLPNMSAKVLFSSKPQID